MLNFSRQTRLWLTAGILLSAYLLLQVMTHGEPIVPRQQLQKLPYAIANWTGQERSLPEQVIQAVGVSDYTNRFYFERAGVPIQLYIGYYASQKTGDTIHSPKNCLPGSGWDPVESRYATIPIVGQNNIVVNEYVIQKDQDKELVFYWYQGRGRVIASEYSGKFWMMMDAVTRNRTDGALVRLVTAMNDGEAKAHARLLGFTQNLFPNVDALIPK